MLHERSSDLTVAAKVDVPIEEFPAAAGLVGARTVRRRPAVETN